MSSEVKQLGAQNADDSTLRHCEQSDDATFVYNTFMYMYTVGTTTYYVCSFMYKYNVNVQ